MIRGASDIRQAYRDEQVAATYVDQRFREPLGALLHHRQLEALKQVIAACRPDHVLEIAPGPARLTVDVAPLLKREAVLVDASRQMLTQAKRRLDRVSCFATFIEADAFQLPFARVFDLVYTFRLIRHFERPDRIRLYEQVGRTLRPGGVLVFDAVNETVSRRLRDRATSDEYQHYDALMKREDLTSELAEAGFHVASLVGVQHRYSMLHQLQVLVAPRSRMLARYAMEAVDRLGGEPLEWVVVCRRA